MIRYLLLSTVIVVGAAVLATAWVNRDLIRIKIASVYARVPAKPGEPNPRQGGSPAPLRGDAPWALSALPECLIQISESTGPQGYVRAHLPPGSEPVAPPATLVYGDCTIFIAGDEAFVRRGADRLHIPPHVRFYRAPGSLALIRESRVGVELRVYQPPQRNGKL
ncbi:MAG: hypothetical protein WA814_10225 [Candidatus Baltobacteraceae bacterium]